MSKSAAPPNSKWQKEVFPGQSVRDVAVRCLKSRLQAVEFWLPLAAEQSSADVENVHQLRVSTRRAAEALRLFAGLLAKPTLKLLRQQLRELRQAAGDARNLDVLGAQFLKAALESSREDPSWKVAELVMQQREAAQQPIIALHKRLIDERIGDTIRSAVESIGRSPKNKAERFGEHAQQYFKPILKTFLKSAEADLSEEEAFHDVRIRAKKLRYSMEIVAAAFPVVFRKKLYQRITSLQNVMGMVNDHATAKTLFGNWMGKESDPQLKAFFQGIVLAEEKAHEDIRDVFFATWTSAEFERLRKQFNKCC
ncbi:MAG: CHAD domain-containing protein [Pirellulaceae bacterium]|jgi:CHAD domain-containing protein